MDYQIPLDVLFNLILVQEDVRPAMLIQPVNYPEILLELILHYVEKEYPCLTLTKEYHGYQGIIVSKRGYTDHRISCASMGKILGYPYYSHFDEVTDQDSYVIEIIATNNEFTTQIMANVCNDTFKLPEFEIIARNAQEVLRKYYQNINVYAVITNIPSYDSVITELLSDRELPMDHIEFVNNQFWNYLTDGNTQGIPEVCTYFDYSNKIHRGILIAYLLDFKHDRLSILYPLKGSTKVHVDKMNKNLNESLIKVLRG